VNDWLTRVRPYVMMTLLNLIIVGGLLLYLRRPSAEPIEIAPPPTATPVPSATPAPTPTPAPTSTPVILYVYVSGAVRHPDVYALADGSRVKQAVEAAGGFTANADSDRINLAAPVVDGQQIYVATKGEENPVVPTPPPRPTPTPVPTSASSQPAPGGKVNINTASAAELETLPRIGPSMAQRIIDYRQQNGPFKSIEDIKNVRGIGDATFEGLKELITVQ